MTPIYQMNPYLFENMPTKVKDFINRDEGIWRRDFIFTVLRGEMLDIIFKIPISKLGNHDKLIWKPTANSRCTVKSAYHLEVRKKKRETRESSCSPAKKGAWRKIWDLKCS